MRKVLEKKEFEKLVQEGIELIPKNIITKLENVQICVENKTLKKSGKLILGLYQGVPKNKRWSYNQVLPDKITIFKKSIERIAQDKEDLKRIVANTIHHEIAHHFGFSEKGIQKNN